MNDIMLLALLCISKYMWLMFYLFFKFKATYQQATVGIPIVVHIPQFGNHALGIHSQVKNSIQFKLCLFFKIQIYPKLSAIKTCTVNKTWLNQLTELQKFHDHS